MPAQWDEKTEPATPRRRSEAREKGQVARSQDLPAAVLLLSAFIALAMFGPGLWQSMMDMLRASLSGEFVSDIDEVLPIVVRIASEAIRRLAPILIVMFIAMIIALLWQVGLLLTLHPLKPSLDRINPLSGLQRLFSIRSVMLALINFGKLLVVAAVAWFTLSGSAAAIIFSGTFEFGEMFRLGAGLIFELSMKLGAALFVLALLDYAWQRYKHERDMRMTKEEVKDEMRTMEGDPQVKKRRRQIQMQLAMQRLRTEVPKADVVVTNPTHLAIAIAYDADSMPAPRVVTKGADHVALRIRQIAREHGIPIVERKPLARAMYDHVEPGDYIPERFYRAIAEILAYVYELTGKAPRGLRRQPVGAA